MFDEVILQMPRLRRRLISSLCCGLFGFILSTTIVPAVAQQPYGTIGIDKGSDRSIPFSAISQDIAEDEETSALLQRGLNLYETGQLSAAATLLQQAAQGFETTGDRLNQALSLNYLSVVYQDLGQWENAKDANTRSLTQLDPNWNDAEAREEEDASDRISITDSPTQQILAQALNGRASLQLALGETEAAIATWKQAESAYASIGDRTGVLGTQINQAQALQVLGLYRRSRQILEEADRQLQDSRDSLIKATGLRSLGRALQVVGDLPQSQQVLEQSLAIAQRLQSLADMSASLFALGNTARYKGEYDIAVEYYHQAAETARIPLDKLQAQLNQLSLLVQIQQWDAAGELLTPIQAQLVTLSPSRSAVYTRVNFAESLIEMLEERGRENENRATIDNRQIAKILATAVQQANQLTDLRAQSYAIGELGHLYEISQQFEEAQDLTQQALAIATNVNAVDIAARWQWQLGRILKQQQEIPSAIAAYSEAVNSLASLRSDLVAINPDVQFSFQQSVEPVYRELVSLLLKSNPTQENLKQARQTIESLQLAELDNYFREACLDAQPVQIDGVDATAAAIYPIILSDRLEVILSVPGQPLRHYATNLPQSQIETTLNNLLESLNPFFSDAERLKFSQQVYDWLIRPAEPNLAAAHIKTLVFVLDGLLRNLPMAALHDGERYLVENYSIAVTPGLQLLAPRTIAREKLTALTGGLTEARQGFSALPAVNEELAEIASQLNTEVILNDNFTIESLKRQIEEASYPVVHLATHGQFSSNPEETFILTWDDKIQVKEFQSLLRSRENRDPTPIELLVLSACQTATGDNRAALGLAGVAVRSGARSTLATLWSVKDRSTAEFMANFYRLLSETDVSKAEAIRRAQIELLNQSQYQHPFYWAPFILVGNWL